MVELLRPFAAATLAVALSYGGAAAETAEPENTAPRLEYERVPGGAALPRDLYQQDETVLNGLFERLSEASSEREARGLEEAIWHQWIRSGSASVDLLMDRGIAALQLEDYPLALELFSEVVALAPDYAEGWNKRATAFYLNEDYSRSIGDIEHVLRLEPRHFGALGGLASILEEIGDKEGALEAYRRALDVHPFLDGAEDAVRDLSVEVEGRGI